MTIFKWGRRSSGDGVASQDDWCFFGVRPLREREALFLAAESAKRMRCRLFQARSALWQRPPGRFYFRSVAKVDGQDTNRVHPHPQRLH